jgi:hypothetical protein
MQVTGAQKKAVLSANQRLHALCHDQLPGPLEQQIIFAFSLTELVFRDTGDYLWKVQSWTRGIYRVYRWQRGQPYLKSVLMPRLSVKSVQMASWLQGRLRVSSNRRCP